MRYCTTFYLKGHQNYQKQTLRKLWKIGCYTLWFVKLLGDTLKLTLKKNHVLRVKSGPTLAQVQEVPLKLSISIEEPFIPSILKNFLEFLIFAAFLRSKINVLDYLNLSIRNHCGGPENWWNVVKNGGGSMLPMSPWLLGPWEVKDLDFPLFLMKSNFFESFNFDSR